MIPAKNVMDVHEQDIVEADSLLRIRKTFAQCTHQTMLVMLGILSVGVCVWGGGHLILHRSHPQQSSSPLYSKRPAVEHVVVALRYKPEGRGFVSRW